VTFRTDASTTVSLRLREYRDHPGGSHDRQVEAFDIGNSFQQSVDSIFTYLPKVLAFLIIVIIGYIIAKVVKKVVNKVLDKVRVDEKLQKGKAGEFVGKMSPGGKPSHLVGAVAFWVIFLFALSSAIGALQIPALTTFR